eukprot:6183511-Pleurochrysis_carterae.AAC.1
MMAAFVRAKAKTLYYILCHASGTESHGQRRRRFHDGRVCSSARNPSDSQQTHEIYKQSWRLNGHHDNQTSVASKAEKHDAKRGSKCE